MERSLLLGAGALGFLGLVCGLLLTPRRSSEPSFRRPLLAAALLPILVFAATLPSAPPFSPGQGWGRGFLLGGLLAWAAAWIVLRASAGQTTPGRAAAVAVPGWAAVLGVAVTLLLASRDTVIDQLLGVTIGWFAVSFVIGLASRDNGDFAALALGTGFAVALCAAAALGVYRDALSPEIARGTWSALAVALAAGVPFALLLGGALPSSTAAWLRIAVALALLVVLAGALSVKVIPERGILTVVVVGLALGLVAWWTRRDAPARRAQDDGETPFWLPPLGLALLLGGFMAAYQMLQGFGAGLMLLAAALPASLAVSKEGAERDDEAAAVASGLIRLFLAGAVLLLYRLFATRFAHDLRGVTLTDHYALFGFLLGAALPGLLARVAGSPHSPSNAALTPRPPLPPAGEAGTHEVGGGVRVGGVGTGLETLLAGAAALAAPGVVVLLWGAKCALALLAGLALGAAGAFDSSHTSRRFNPTLSALLAVAVALALAQWTGHVLPLADMTRAAKIRVLTGVIGALVALVVASDAGARLRRRGSER